MAGYSYIESTGTIVSDVSDLREQVVAEWVAIFGSALDTDSSTPEGQLIDQEVLSRASIQANNALLANQINPDLSGGVYLDALVALLAALGAERTAATKSTFSTNPDLIGEPSAILTAGAIATTTAGDQFELISSVTFDVSGNATGEFQSVEDGPIPAPIGTLTTPGDNVGWFAVNNTVAATLGTDQESDVQLRQRRRRTIGGQGTAVLQAITAAVESVDNVDSAHVQENVSGSVQIINGVTMASHSVYVAVSGGGDDDVANALWDSKSLGAGWNLGPGTNVTVVVTDPLNNQDYTVDFDRAEDVPILVNVTIDPGTETDSADKVKSAMIDYVNGDIDNEDGWRVSSDASPFELSGAVNIQYPLIKVTDCQITKAAVISYAATTIPIEVWEQATLEESSITVTIL